jgi:DNA-binding CsgD family transcriptional regulator
MMQTSLQSAFCPPAEAQQRPEFSLLSAVLEGFTDGVLIVDKDGTCIHHNQEGQALCKLFKAQLNQTGKVPACLWAICQHLIEGRNLFPDQSIVLTQTLNCPQGRSIRAKVQWLKLPTSQEPYLLIFLEDEFRATQTTALLESLQYNLTPREKDVWLLKRANHSYEEIAKQLFIAVNTVKRHIKSIYAKRKLVLDEMANSVG